MSDHTTTFHKIDRGLYGTDVWREVFEHEFLYCKHGCDCIEVCIDGYTNRDGWYVRYVCKHGHFTDILGEWFPTLRDAKAFLTKHPQRVQ